MVYVIQNPIDGSYLAPGEFQQKIVQGEPKPVWGRIWTFKISEAKIFTVWSIAEATAGNLFWNFCQANPAYSYMTAIKPYYHDELKG